MKNSNTFFILIFLVIAVGHAQITKPKLNVTHRPNIGKIEPGIKVKTNKISLNDLNKLAIPTMRVTDGIVNTKPVRSWKVSPVRTQDGILQLHMFYGTWYRTHFNYGVGLGYRDFPNDFREDFSNRNQNSTPNNTVRYIFPLIVKIRAREGERYLLSFGAYNSWPHDSLLIGRNLHITRVYFVDGQISYVFDADETKDLYIFISPKTSAVAGGRIVGFNPTSLTGEIKLEQLNRQP